MSWIHSRHFREASLMNYRKHTAFWGTRSSHHHVRHWRQQQNIWRVRGKGTNWIQQMHNAFEPADIEQLGSSDTMGNTDPVTLQQSLWWLIATRMGTRGREATVWRLLCWFHHRRPRVRRVFCREGNENKNRWDRGKHIKIARVFKLKMWATPDMPSRCPVRLYHKFLEKHPPDMCTPSSPFYLAINNQGTKTSHWTRYKNNH